MTHVNDDDADDSIFDDTLSEILGAPSRVSTSLDLDLAFDTVDLNVDLACTSLLSPLSPSPRLSSSFCCCWGAHLRSRSFHYRISKILDSLFLLLLFEHVDVISQRQFDENADENADVTATPT